MNNEDLAKYRKNHTHEKKVRHISEFLFVIY